MTGDPGDPDSTPPFRKARHHAYQNLARADILEVGDRIYRMAPVTQGTIMEQLVQEAMVELAGQEVPMVELKTVWTAVWLETD